jgi:lactoylglutathione lyase
MSVRHFEGGTGFRTGHVGLNVSDLQRSTAFYREVFDFELLRESVEDGRRFAFLGAGGTPGLTLWQQAGGRFDRGRPGLHHLAFEVGSAAELEALEARVRASGARLLYDGIVPHAEGASSGAVFFEDPDGIRLEVYSPEGAEAATAPTPDGPACGFF